MGPDVEGNAVQMRHLAIVLVVALPGCTTLPNGRLWGQDATLRPGWDRARSAMVDAARDPRVWVPLIGAVAFQIDDFDRRTSDWAREHTPVFGSQNSADDWSDDLRTASSLALFVSLAATPGGDDPGEWFKAKAKGLMIDVTAIGATSLVTDGLKSVTDRERPNGLDRESFPSGHTSSSAVQTRLASNNLRSIDMSRGERRFLDAGLTAMTIGTGWARIEAGAHFPSDTLFSMALGNFIATFADHAFLGLTDLNGAVTFAPMAGGAAVQWNWSF